jgi:hypothetical protein
MQTQRGGFAVNRAGTGDDEETLPDSKRSSTGPGREITGVLQIELSALKNGSLDKKSDTKSQWQGRRR